MWDTKYRPLKFGDVLGQPGTVQLLKARLRNGTALNTSYVFSGGHGQGKCVVGGTLVPTDRGLVPIVDLMGPNQIDPSGRTVQQEGGTTTAAFSYRGGIRETVRITTHRGFQLEGTPNHRILVMTPQGCLDWKCLGDMIVGDQACIIPRGLFGEDVSLSGFSYEKYPQDHSSLGFTPPKRITSDLARLLGYMTGDGCGPSRKVSISCAETDVIQDQERLLRSILGSCSITPDKRRTSLVSVRCLRVQPRAFLSYAGVAYVKAGQKEVPWAVRQSSKKVVREFLRGYLESDGGVCERSGTLEFLSKSEKLARQVRLLLLQFGVVGRLYKKRHPEYGVYWRWQAFGSDLLTFQSEIGFVSARKRSALSRIASQVKGLTRSIPFQKPWLRSFYAHLPKRDRASSSLFKARQDGYGLECTEATLVRAVKHDPANPVSQHFARLVAARFVYDPVVAIRSGNAEVFDLNVPEGESFAANGFINHNTTLARIMARAILCQELNKDDPEPCNACDNCRDILNETSTAFFERDAASNGTIDKIRAIVDDLPFAVMGAAKRIYLFDEAHRMSRDAQDVLLKPIEDDKMVAMLCTTEVDKIRGTILSRCEPYAVRKVTREDILERMRKVLTAENVQFEDDAVLIVIDHSGGHVRDVLNRLEMIAQMGAISIDNVREYLHLGVITLYYDILLSIGEPGRSVDLVEQACERATPEDVAAGLAEASMNSYRLANGMHADFVFVDREKAQKVYEKFGQGCLERADYFLSIRYATRVSLACAVVRLAAGMPTTPMAAPAVPVPPPPAQVPPTAQVQTATVSLAVASSPPVAQLVQQASSMQHVQAEPPKPNGVHKVGNVGSSDPMALTELDQKAVPQNMPRRPNTTTVIPTVFKGKTEGDLDLLTPDEWRREFERTWPGLR